MEEQKAADTLEVVDFTAETSEIPWVPEPLLEAVAVGGWGRFNTHGSRL